jgi:mRNA-degrading endonuclease YafQ of YafQ-DinJ toxin-antitoxin module
MYKLIPTDPYVRSLKGLLKNNDSLKNKLIKTLDLLRQDPNYPSLKSHKSLQEIWVNAGALG